MKNTKGTKVLIVEDSQVQINWAREQLSDYSLTIVENIQDAKSILESDKFEVIISDLELPENCGEKPLMDNGLKFIKDVLTPFLFKVEKPKIAVVSNYEHHKRSDELVGTPDKNIVWKKELDEGHLLKKQGERDGFMVIFDWPVNSYSHYRDNGKILTNKEMKEKYGKSGGYKLIVENKEIPLKSYEKVVRELLEN